MKGSSSRMKTKVGAQKGAFIKMKQENMYVYQRLYVVCYVPIIAPFKSITYTKLIALNFLSGTDLGQRCQNGVYLLRI